jgi:hypothetical protein
MVRYSQLAQHATSCQQLTCLVLKAVVNDGHLEDPSFSEALRVLESSDAFPALQELDFRNYGYPYSKVGEAPGHYGTTNQHVALPLHASCLIPDHGQEPEQVKAWSGMDCLGPHRL